MQLHRVGKQSDWDTIPSSKRTVWQRIAASSHGIITPGNVITILGAVLLGLSTLELARNAYWSGLLLIGLGRLCDLLDGWLADRTGTKGYAGELLDATVDKIAVVFIILVIIATAIAPWWLVAALLAVQLLISWQGAVNYMRTSRQHAVRSGKLSMAALWVSLLAFILGKAWPTVHVFGVIMGYALAAASLVLGIGAFGAYFRLRKPA